MSYALAFAEALNEKFSKDAPLTHPWEVRAGRKFDKLIENHSVYAFVDKETGELIKAAGWETPAKNANGETAGKYFLSTEEGFAIALLNADRYASFLYSSYQPILEVVS